MMNHDKNHILKDNSDDIANKNWDKKNDEVFYRPKIYTNDEHKIKNPNVINNIINRNYSNDGNDYNNRKDHNNINNHKSLSRQYVYKVDQFRHYQELTH